MRRVLAAVPWLLLTVAVGVAGWIGWDARQAVREANEPGTTVALDTTTTTAATSTSSTSTSTSTSTTTTVPVSALDGIVIFTSDTCPECPFLRVRLQGLAGEVPVWVRPPEEGMVRLPVVVVQYAGDVKGRWEGQVAVNSAEAIASFTGERWAGWVAAASGITTTTTLPLWLANPLWCNDPATPGEYVAGDVIGDVVVEHGEYAFIFIRVLELLGYHEFVFEHDRFGSWELGFWKIRASVLERGVEVDYGEFIVGGLTLAQVDPPQMTVDLIVTPLTSMRVPFDDCASGRSERESFMLGRWPVSADLVVQSVLEVGRVYGVGILIREQTEIPPDDECLENTAYCQLVRGTVAYNRQLSSALSEGDLDALVSLKGWGRIDRIFVPAQWYDFSQIPPGY